MLILDADDKLTTRTAQTDHLQFRFGGAKKGVNWKIARGSKLLRNQGC